MISTKENNREHSFLNQFFKDKVKSIYLSDEEGNRNQFILISGIKIDQVKIFQKVNNNLCKWDPDIEIKNRKDALNFLSTQGYNKKNWKGGNDK